MMTENARKLPGLVTDCEIEAIAVLASTHNRILEIGSYLGKSTRAFADNTQGIVVACDNFNGPRDAVLTWKERQSVHSRFVVNMGEHIGSKKVIPWKVNHEEMTPEALWSLVSSEEKFDLCFIDGGHNYDDVMRDIKFARSILAPDGMACGHDFQFGAPDVIRAVSESFGNIEVMANTSIWRKTLGGVA